MNLSILFHLFRKGKLGKLKHKSVYYLHAQRHDIETKLY